MENDGKRNAKCENPGCGRIAASGSRYCETCELEWTLYRRDLRVGDREKESLAVESR
jgi:hypothetical protein